MEGLCAVTSRTYGTIVDGNRGDLLSGCRSIFETLGRNNICGPRRMVFRCTRFNGAAGNHIKCAGKLYVRTSGTLCNGALPLRLVRPAFCLSFTSSSAHQSIAINGCDVSTTNGSVTIPCNTLGLKG